MADYEAGFLQELRKRKVFRVAGAYLIAAWIALQVFDLVLENIDAPAWVMRTVMAVLAIGFPIALVLAWAFEVSMDPSGTTPRRNRAFAVLVAVVSVGAIGASAWVFLGSAGDDGPAIADTAAPELRVIDSIAVLPFETFSGDTQDEYFADGLADTLLHKLAQLRNLKVIARNSSFQFKGSNKDVREIGKLLDVAALLEGSVQRQGDQVRIIAQLIDTGTGVHLWSGTFDDSFSNIFELQDRLAQSIMEQLQISISEREVGLTLRHGTDSPEAYDLLMRAIGSLPDMNRERFDPDTDRSLELIDQSLAIDPGYAQAWELRSDLFSSALFFGNDPARSYEFVDEAVRAAERAIEADPEYAGGWTAMGVARFRTRDLQEAEKNLVRALELNPGLADAMRVLGLVKMNSDPEFALDLLMRSREIDPQSSFNYRQIYLALDALGRLDEGIDILLQGVERFPDQTILMGDLASKFLMDKGSPVESARWASRIVALDSQDLSGQRAMSTLWAAVGDIERSADWLALFAGRFPNSATVLLPSVMLDVMSGDPQAGREAIEATPEGTNFRFDRATPLGGVCLVLGDADCMRAQARRMSEWLAEYAASGRPYAPGERYEIALAILDGAAIGDPASRDVARLQSQLEESENWPVTGGRGYRWAGYLRVMLQSLLGNDEDAVRELDATMAFGDDGYLYRDIFRLPPDANPLITRLEGTPGYAAWLGRLAARRESARGRLLQMERDGEILAARDAAP